MRLFELTEELELRDGERLVGVYLPGLLYTCFDDEPHAVLSEALDRWIDEGRARVVESRGTQPAQLSGHGEIE